MRSDIENIIVEKTFQFALKIVAFCEILEEKRKYVIARQLLKAGTSIGANTREAQNIAPNQPISTLTHFQIFKLTYFHINPFSHFHIKKFSN